MDNNLCIGMDKKYNNSDLLFWNENPYKNHAIRWTWVDFSPIGCPHGLAMLKLQIHTWTSVSGNAKETQGADTTFRYLSRYLKSRSFLRFIILGYFRCFWSSEFSILSVRSQRRILCKMSINVLLTDPSPSPQEDVPEKGHAKRSTAQPPWCPSCHKIWPWW